MWKQCAKFSTILMLLLGFVGLDSVCAQGPEQPPPAPPVGRHGGPRGLNETPALKYVSPGVFEIGKCTIIKDENRVEFPASVNMKEGLLEYLLVGNTGKLHESLLRTDIEPYALQVALLLSGLEGSLKHLSAQGENRTPEGDPVEIMVSWSEEGKAKKARIETMVLDGKNAVDQIPWVFTGSIIRNGAFAAQVEKSIIAIYHDPVAMIDHRLASGASDERWFANSKAVPPIGTPITVSISKKVHQPKK